MVLYTELQVSLQYGKEERGMNQSADQNPPSKLIAWTLAYTLVVLIY